MGRTENLIETIAEKFGEKPQIEYFSGPQWNVVLWGWHIHNGTGYGTLSACGTTLKAALERLLMLAEKYPTAKSPHCTRSCPHYVSDGFGN